MEKEQLAAAVKNEIENPKPNSIFKIQSANDWIEQAKNRPIPKMLFGELWFEGEICILFADTNLGKSILAVQIANSISKGVATCGLKLGIQQTPVIYFDFELSDKQFENRYSDEYKSHFKFSDLFSRAELNPENYDTNVDFEKALYISLENSVVDGNVKILIIDNITYLKSETEKSKDALSLMKLLKDLKTKYNLSILVLAHTPKIDPFKPISKNHSSGSKMIMNFCDSSFAIGQSYRENGLRYIKQIKQRNCEQIYDSENVIVCKIEKENSFLSLNFIGYEKESEHLKQLTDEEKSQKDIDIIELHKNKVSNVQIGLQFGISESTVRNILKRNNI